MALVDDDGLKRALYPLVSSILSAPVSAAPVTVSGRYVRVMLPGRERTLGLAEVEVLSGGTNIAPKGATSQSSGIPGGDFGGGAAEAVDGNTDVAQAGKAASFTTRELDPWWEIDLGAEGPVDTLVIRPYLAEGANSRGALHVAVLNDKRETVATADGLSTGVPVHTVRLGGDLTPALREAAITALPAIPGHDAEVVRVLASLVGDEASRATAVEALSRIAPERWPGAEVAGLVENLLAYARTVPPAGRTAPAFKQAIALGRSAAARLPGDEAARITSALDALTVRTIRITALLAQMKFDISTFAVAPGEEVEIVLVNADHMPHNLLITAPGALESVALKAEAMAAQPDAFQKHFVPDTPEVLHATRLINHEEIARLRFTAPAAEGKHPYVCTFPGHWRTMNGVMDVVKPAVAPTEARR